QQAPASQAPAAETGQAAAAKSQNDVTLKTPKDKASYVIGMNIGKNLQKDSVDVDPDILLQGIKDALAGGKSLLTDDEAKAALSALQTDVSKRQQEKMQVAGET